MILRKIAPALNAALADATHSTAEAADFSRRMQPMLNEAASWQQPAATATPPPANATQDSPLTVLENLPLALENARQSSPAVSELVDAIHLLSPRLQWYKRPPSGDDGFMESHALTTLVGHHGLVPSEQWRIGLVLTSARTNYPAHRHPPEEMYLVLSKGEWRNTNQQWHLPGIAATVYNPPNIEHAMRANDEPLFALWCQAI